MKYVAFPFKRDSTTSDGTAMMMITCLNIIISTDDIVQHPALIKLESVVDMTHTCGYITMLCTGQPVSVTSNNGMNFQHKRLIT